MKMYHKENVWDAALNRIRYLFDEFNCIIVGCSGGKDSTVIYNLAMIVAKEKKRLPLKVMFLDQEVEWQSTIEQIKRIMYNPDVDPMWMQVPFKLVNSTSNSKLHLNAWAEAEKSMWMREKDPISIKDQHYIDISVDMKPDQFSSLLIAIPSIDYPDKKIAVLTGVRAEESPTRYLGLIRGDVYKGISWGATTKFKNQIRFHPLYDWSYTDIWKAIHDNKWEYNTLYNDHYRYGVSVKDMRVSSLSHETSIASLRFLQAIEPLTYERMTERLAGISTVARYGKKMLRIKEVPFMFSGWQEYRDYLLEHLITDPDSKARFKVMFDRHDELYGDQLAKVHVQGIMANDSYGIKIRMAENNLMMGMRSKAGYFHDGASKRK